MKDFFDTRTRGSRLSIRGLSKSYGGVRALAQVDLEVHSGEFLAVLGPSGSGKSTLLMALAGFESPDSGEILIDDRDVSGVPSHKRDIGMIFQRYALFPNLDVRRNIEYPLRARGIPRSARVPLVNEALRLVSLEEFANRAVNELSGGQQQRVALARAIVFSPKLLLMDEPLGALDRKLRERVQLELRALHRRIGATIVFVTHDQGEAMTMADRIAVMDHAVVSQIGTPRELYERPANRFVANFLGAMNFLDVSIVAETSGGLRVNLGGREVEVCRNRVMLDLATVPAEGHLSLAARPHGIDLVDDADAHIRGVVQEVVFEGAATTLLVDTTAGQLACQDFSARGARAKPGDEVSLRIRTDAALLYSEQRTKN